MTTSFDMGDLFAALMAYAGLLGGLLLLGAYPLIGVLLLLGSMALLLWAVANLCEVQTPSSEVDPETDATV